MTDVFARLKGKKAQIGIVGMGYVGLPLALRFAEVGFAVTAFDVDPEKIEKLNARQSYLDHVPGDRLREAFRESFRATCDFANAASCDALIICVPTPLGDHREPDLGAVIASTESLLPHLRKGQVISLESTTYPGTTEEEILPRITRQGFTVGKDIYLVYSPEREDPGNTRFNTATTPKVCGGVTSQCLEVGLALYREVVNKVVPVSSTRAAELTKLLENIHRAVNIGLVNELKRVADRMNIDIFEVIDAAATKPFGFTPYYPGPGLGGHCIPIDPFYLTWKAREYGVSTKFIELAGEINAEMPRFVVSKVSDALNSQGVALSRARILLLGLSYKKNIDDLRESPSLHIWSELIQRGATVAFSDPYIPHLHADQLHGAARTSLFGNETAALPSTTLSPETLRAADCVIIATDHDRFDYGAILENARLIVDTRGRLRGGHAHVFPA